MDGITIPQLIAANWVLIAVAIAAAISLVMGIWLGRRRRRRQLPTTIGGVRIECQGAHVDEDLVVERNWRITFLLTNVTKKPAQLPVLSSRAVIRSGRNEYAATLFLEHAASELNPDDALVVWVLCKLPSGEVPGGVRIDVLTDHTRVLQLVERSPTER